MGAYPAGAGTSSVGMAPVYWPSDYVEYFGADRQFARYEIPAELPLEHRPLPEDIAEVRFAKSGPFLMTSFGRSDSDFYFSCRFL